MYLVEHLNPLDRYLPDCAKMEEIDNPDNPKKKAIKVTYLRTYPPYPWLPDTGDHRNDDPVKFIDICAEAGLVHWETKEQKEARMRSEGQDPNAIMSYKEFLRDQELIKNMPEERGDY